MLHFTLEPGGVTNYRKKFEKETHNYILTAQDGEVVMKSYKIEVGATVSIYEAESETEALEVYAKDAGYASYADVVAEYGEIDSITENE